MGIRSVKCVLVVLLLTISGIFAQSQKRITGFILDKQTGEMLIGATVFDTLSKREIATDNNGYFTLITNDNPTLQCSYPGYKTLWLPIENNEDPIINISLEPNEAETLDEVVVTGSRYKGLDVSTLSVKEMMRMPALGGKPDIGKSLQLLPGISTQNEGSSLLLVRGGDPGQNLYLFDNVPVIYVNHLGGFMSVFNPDIINHIDVYKGGFPARYGGRLSSIVDITQREGDVSHTKGSLSIGLTDLSFSAEGPLVKNTTFIVGGRKTLIDPLMAMMSSMSDGGENNVAYGFHDVNGGLTWKPNRKHTLSFNLYYGDDYLNYWSKRNIGNAPNENKNRHSTLWGNWLASMHWKSMISQRVFANTSVSYTRYRLREGVKFSVGSPNERTNVLETNLSSVQNMALKTELKYTPFRNWSIGFGAEAIVSSYQPFYSYGTYKPEEAKNHILSSDNALFVDNTLSFLRYSKIHAGGRFVGYSTSGYSNYSFEPRIRANFGLNPNHFLNLSFMSVNQHAHLLFNSGGMMSNEVWIPSSSDIPSSSSTQYSAGWSGSFNRGMYSAEVLVFHKTLDHLSMYKEGFSNLSGDTYWPSKVETHGTGTSKGLELMLKKNSGDLTGFLSYTLSNSTRQYPGVNAGKSFLFDYDRLNQLSISINYKLSKKLSVGASWVYMTGLPYTPAIGTNSVPELYPFEERQYYKTLLYGERNSERMKDYHRLDVGLTYEKLTKRNRRESWSLSVYNAYNRQNPYYYYYNTNATGEIIPDPYTHAPLSLYQISFFPILPTIAYKVYFDGRASSNNNKSNKPRINKLLYHDD